MTGLRFDSSVRRLWLRGLPRGLPNPGLPKWMLGVALCAALFASGCQRKKPIVVATKPATEQMLLGEIVAQHLETRLPDLKIERRLAAGSTAILFQAIAGGDVTLYPESIGVIATNILKEQPNSDPAILLERDRQEIARRAQLELLELGFEDALAVVVPAKDTKETTLSAAAEGKNRWRLAITPEFEQDSGLQALNSYHLPLAAPMRTLETRQLFDAMARGDVNMVVTTMNDGHLTDEDWRALQDDKKAFPSQQLCLLVRQDRINDEPRLRPALRELSGKLTVDMMRKLNRQIDLDHSDVPGTARRFLAAIGLH